MPAQSYGTACAWSCLLRLAYTSRKPARLVISFSLCIWGPIHNVRLDLRYERPTYLPEHSSILRERSMC